MLNNYSQKINQEQNIIKEICIVYTYIHELLLGEKKTFKRFRAPGVIAVVGNVKMREEEQGRELLFRELWGRNGNRVAVQMESKTAAKVRHLPLKSFACH